MPLRIQNYGDWRGDKPGGHHPPACTCYRCNEQRREDAAAKAQEEAQRVIEQGQRVAESQAQSQAESPAESGGEGRVPGQNQAAPIRNLSPRPADHNRPSQQPPLIPPPLPPPRPGASSGLGQGRPGSRQAAPIRNLSPRPADHNRPSQQPPLIPPPLPPPRPGASSGLGQGRPGSRQGSSLSALLWLLLIGVAVGSVIVVLYVVNPGLFTPSGDEGPVAVAAPPPTEESPTEIPPRILTPTPAPTPTPTSDSEPTPTLEPRLTLAPLIASTPLPTRIPSTTQVIEVSINLPTLEPTTGLCRTARVSATRGYPGLDSLDTALVLSRRSGLAGIEATWSVWRRSEPPVNGSSYRVPV